MDICSKLISFWGRVLTACGLVFGIAFFIGFETIWKGLQSMNEGTGAMFGAFFGLFAILLGALFNAKLNRDRDERLLANERASMAASLISEIQHISDICKSRSFIISRQYETHYKNLSEQASFSLLDTIPPFGKNMIYESISHKVGIFGADISLEIANIYHHIHDLEAICTSTKLKPEMIKELPNQFATMSSRVDDLVQKLTAIVDQNKST